MKTATLEKLGLPGGAERSVTSGRRMRDSSEEREGLPHGLCEIPSAHCEKPLEFYMTSSVDAATAGL
jgi:hypothetical protein